MLLIGFKAYGQVGVNTESPQGVFHIDAQKNTNGNTNVADDVIVNSSGNVGVGTNNPLQKLHVTGNSYVSGISKIGAGTTFNNSAQVELSDANKGLLLNRVALTAANVKAPVTNAVAGMMVYNTTSNAQVTPGIYYWNGVNWIRMVTEIPKSTLNLLNLVENVATTDGGTDGSGGVLLKFNDEGYIEIPEDGSYAFSFRLYGKINDIPVNYLAAYYLTVWVNGSIVDIAEIDIYGGEKRLASNNNWIPAYTYSIVVGCDVKAGEKVSFKLSHSENTSYPWTLQYSLQNSANRTSMIWWKL
ncbi:hypothetical protein D0T56_09040 [Dysgonomonas sp. 520]|nr:hypothetical protein [Dysgonomonas sp. 520]